MLIKKVAFLKSVVEQFSEKGADVPVPAGA